MLGVVFVGGAGLAHLLQIASCGPGRSRSARPPRLRAEPPRPCRAPWRPAASLSAVKVCFVLPDRSPSGGAAVASAHARGLSRDHGVEAELVTLDALDQAQGPYDVAIATWWETVPALWQLDAARRALLFQSFEQRFYDRDAPLEQVSAETTLALPLDYIAVSHWLRDALLRLRPDARCHVVQPGIDKGVFTWSGAAARDGPLEVLIEGQPTLPFKGVQEAVASVQAMREPVRTTLVALDPDLAGDAQVDRVVGGLEPRRWPSSIGRAMCC